MFKQILHQNTTIVDHHHWLELLMRFFMSFQLTTEFLSSLSRIRREDFSLLLNVKDER